ncbi:hypothetical protein [Novosphingobium sp. BL-52-GroH]|uniref:hypothetical protein n=1 Tax=Novosphingobium sp. BL-52-GroH TaxID=3349877 RepID=UPI00384E6348
MIPSIELRLDSMTRALQQVIIPAIDPGNSLALEQAALMLGHIGLIVDQISVKEAFAALCLDDIASVVADLDPQGGAAVAAVMRQINEQEKAPGETAEAAYARLSGLIEQLIRAADIDGTQSFRADLHKAVLHFSKRQARRDRIWFAKSGFDPDNGELPTIRSLLATREVGGGS